MGDVCLPARNCLLRRVSRCARRSLRRPLPVKIAATTAPEFGNRAHLATGWHFVEAHNLEIRGVPQPR